MVKFKLSWGSLWCETINVYVFNNLIYRFGTTNEALPFAYNGLELNIW